MVQWYGWKSPSELELHPMYTKVRETRDICYVRSGQQCYHGSSSNLFQMSALMTQSNFASKSRETLTIGMSFEGTSMLLNAVF